MDNQDEHDLQSVDSEREIYFRQRKQTLRPDEPNRQDNQSEDDRLSESSFHTVDRVQTNESPRAINDNNEDAFDQVNSLMRDVTGVLKDVVIEMKNLSKTHSQPVVKDQNEFRANMTNSRYDNFREPNRYMFNRAAENENRYAQEMYMGDQNANNEYQPNMTENHLHQGRQMRSLYRSTVADEPVSQRQRFIPHQVQTRRMPRYGNVKIPPFTGQEDWKVWSSKFEAIASRYRWTEDDMLDNLIPRLEGQAAEFVFSQLPTEVLNDYHELVAELTRRYRVIETSRSFAAKFSRRNQRHGETAEEYATELKRLYGKAHGHRDIRIRDEDLVRRFLDGLLDLDTKFEVEYHKEPRDIDEAVYHVVNLIQTKGSFRHERQSKHSTRQAYVHRRDDSSEESHKRSDDGDDIRPTQSKKQGTKQEIKQCVSQKEVENNSQEDLLQRLLKRVERLEGKGIQNSERRNYKDIECFNCHEKGHYARMCPNKGNNAREKQMVDHVATRNQPLNYRSQLLCPKRGPIREK